MSEEQVESPEMREYRLRARAWVAAHLPTSDGWDDDDPTPEQLAEDRRIQALLYEAGYAGFTFPRGIRRSGSHPWP